MSEHVRRIEALVQRIDPPPSANMIHIIICEPGETGADAEARYRNQYQVHPASCILVINTRAASSSGEDVR